MDKVLYFFYGLFTGIGIVILGIIGWGFNILMRVISLAPTGLAVVAAICALVLVVFGLMKTLR